MRMTSRNYAGISVVEVFIALVVIVIIILAVIPSLSENRAGVTRSQMTQTLSNMRQLHLATQQMTLDWQTTNADNIGWPGDIGGTFSNWTTQLVKGGYLWTSDLCKLLSAPGVIVPSRAIPLTNNTALLVYAVSTNSPGTAVFLTTANFTNTPTGGVLNPAAEPYGEKGFLVFRLAGDGAVLRAKQAGDTNVVGSYVPLCR